MSVTTDRRVRLFKRDAQAAATRMLSRVKRPPTAPLRDAESAGNVDSASRERRLTLARRVAITTWILVVAYRSVTDGLAFNRELLLLYIATGLIAASIGRGHTAFAVLRDWLPFALVLLLYDLSRGAATLLGAPTLWRFQPDADRWLFFGTVPTVWLQERMKMPQPPWWEVIISGIYMSFFVLPYVVAGVLWLHNRSDWAAFVRRFVALSFAALVVYIVMPAAPPWAAARCTPADIAGWPVRPTLHVPKLGRGSRRRAAGRDAHQPARCPPVRRADLHSRLGNAASAVGRRAGQLRTGQRESGRGDSLAARRVDRDDLDLPVAAGQAQVAPAAGGLPAGDGLRAGVLRRAFRHRHPARLGARRDGVAGVRPFRLVVVPPPQVEVSSRRCG